MANPTEVSVVDARRDSQPADASQPTTGKVRFEILDALRGFALFGVLVANLRDFSLFDLLPEATRATLPSARWDGILNPALSVLVDAKFMTIFTILFGVGFAIQMRRATNEDAGSAQRRFARRMLVLLGLGLVHAYLFWWGDILRFYGLFGLVLVPLARCRPRILIGLGLFTAIVGSVLLRPAMVAVLPSTMPAAGAHQMALAAFSGTSLTGAWQANLSYDVWTRLSAWGLPLYVLGRILVGAAIGKMELLQRFREHACVWQRLLWTLLPVGVALTAFIVLRDNDLLGSGSRWWKTDTARNIVRMARSGASLAMGLSYVAAFALVYRRPAAQRLLGVLGPAGRMALTNYLLQTVIGLLLFYGIGFGLGPRYGLPAVVVSAIVVFTGQIALSRWWLARYAFGPCEWFWRCLTYGRLLPIRLSATRSSLLDAA